MATLIIINIIILFLTENQPQKNVCLILKIFEWNSEALEALFRIPCTVELK